METGARIEPVRHRQTKGAATDRVDLKPPRHTPTLPNLSVRRRGRSGIVKGFRMPASHRAEGLHGGRRPKSLEGGNRKAPQSQDRTPACATPRDPSLATNYRGSALVLRRNFGVRTRSGEGPKPFTKAPRCRNEDFRNRTHAPLSSAGDRATRPAPIRGKRDYVTIIR